MNILLSFKYKSNISNYISYHPVASINTFIIFTFYYAMLFVYIRILVENKLCIYLIGIYPLTDFAVVFISLFKLRRVIGMKR